MCVASCRFLLNNQQRATHIPAGLKLHMLKSSGPSLDPTYKCTHTCTYTLAPYRLHPTTLHHPSAPGHMQDMQDTGASMGVCVCQCCIYNGSCISLPLLLSHLCSLRPAQGALTLSHMSLKQHTITTPPPPPPPFAAPRPPTQDRHPVRPLDVLCEAKVSAASPTFIKCSCEACTGGAAGGHAGGSFNSVSDFLAHGREVFGPHTVVVLAELELSWPGGGLGERGHYTGCDGVSTSGMLGRRGVKYDGTSRHAWWKGGGDRGVISW